MNWIRRVPASKRDPVDWTARLSSLMVNCVFLLILILAVTNEDKPQGPAVVVLVLLALDMLASCAAWRWRRIGGALVVAGGICLGVAAYSASLSFGLRSSGLLSMFIYGAPFVLLGILFWISGGRLADGAAR